MNERQASILKGVSRSFYLSLRLLPKPMREAASIAYLLARASDTLADASEASVKVRLAALDDFEHHLNHCHDGPKWSDELIESVQDSNERELLQSCDALWQWMHGLHVKQLYLVADVVTTIMAGQRHDLNYFSGSTAGQMRSMKDADALDDYTWKVAGCVGEFWTKLGYLAMGKAYSGELEGVMIRRGIRYGKGLQLVNILRDMPKDLRAGRCYLPVADVNDIDEIMQVHRDYVQKAATYLHDGVLYTEGLGSRRLQVATGLPAMIGLRTLSKLQGITWDQLEAGVKVSRDRVYLYLLMALIGLYHVEGSFEIKELNS